MTFNQLYPIVQELVFGEDNRIYLLLSEWEERKFVGKNLPKLLEELNINIDKPSLGCWDLCIEGTKKYLFFGMPNNNVILMSNLTENSTVIDLRDV